MIEKMRYKLTFGGRYVRHLTYTGVMVTPSLQEYAARLIFEEGGLNTGQHGDRFYRDRDNYHVAIFTGRGEYIVVLSYNLGLGNAARGNDHDGYLMLDVKMCGSSVSEALLQASRVIRDLTGAVEFTPIDAEDRETFEKAKAKWAKDQAEKVA